MRKFEGYGPAVVVVATIGLTLLVGPRLVEHFTYRQTHVRMLQASERLDESTAITGLNQAYRDIATFVEPSVVHISASSRPTELRQISLSSGSGWIFNDEGAIVTNYHVVRDADEIDVQLASGKLRRASILGFDQTTDIAVLTIDADDLHPATLADLAEPVQQGDVVFAFGSPFDFRFSMSSGIVSGSGRSTTVLGDAGYENFIQVDAAINPGNSGGPLTNHRGHVIGMNTAIATSRQPSLDEGQFAGIGLAIPLDMIVPVVTQVIEKGYVEKGYLGVSAIGLDEVPRYRPAGFEERGLFVNFVMPDTPADLAGILAKDIITHLDGNEINTSAQLRAIISSKIPGESVLLDIYRDSTREQLSFDIPLEKLDPQLLSRTAPFAEPVGSLAPVGIASMATATEERCAELGVRFHTGVLIERVVPGSYLAGLNVSPGTLIVTVQDRPIVDVEGLLRELQSFDLRSRETAPSVRLLLPDGRVKKVRLHVPRAGQDER